MVELSVTKQDLLPNVISVIWELIQDRDIEGGKVYMQGEVMIDFTPDGLSTLLLLV